MEVLDINKTSEDPLDIITKKELSNVSSMLYAAAMTYLASFFASFAQMLRLFLQINRRNN